jgi:hypothetical protein
MKEKTLNISVRIPTRKYMANKSLFSPRDCFALADNIVTAHHKFNLLYKFAKMEDNEQMMADFQGIAWELNLIIEAYGFRDMTKIN